MTLFHVVALVAIGLAFGIGVLIGRSLRPDYSVALRCPICLTVYGSTSAVETCREACRQEATRKGVKSCP